MTLLIDFAYAVAVLVGWPWLLIRRWRRGPGSLALRERLGAVPLRPVAAQCIWIHGVSLGEVNATRTLVAELHRRAPDVAIVVSSTTKTGLDRARQLYPRLTVFRFPLDFSFVIRRVLARIRPTIIVLMELEVWPNLVAIAAARGIPVVIANGRITHDRSVRRFQRPLIRRLARRMFGAVRWVGAQDLTYAQRFVQLGVPPQNVEVVGSLKYDAADVADRVEGQERLAGELAIDTTRPLWVCGSTGPGEESRLLDVYAELLRTHPGLQLALVPRKPERFDEVAELIVQRGFACLRRSGKPPLVPPDVPVPIGVYLGDTMGELRKFYALATVVFVGRTLVPLGGSDVMEVAGLGKPLVVGPCVENFAEAVERLEAADACVRIQGPDQLAGAVDSLLRDPARRNQIASRAREVIVSCRGATAATTSRILSFAGITE